MTVTGPHTSIVPMPGMSAPTVVRRPSATARGMPTTAYVIVTTTPWMSAVAPTPMSRPRPVSAYTPASRSNCFGARGECVRNHFTASSPCADKA